MIVSPVAGAGFTLANALTGTGMLTAIMGQATDVFTFAPTVGNTFAGTVTLGDGTFDLTGDNTAALERATLNLASGNTTTVGGDPLSPAIQTIRNLTLSGGKLVFDGPTPTDPISPDKITTSTLTMNSGTVQVTIPDTASPPPDWHGPGSNLPLLMQDGVVISQLVNATSVAGDASSLILVNQDGAPILPGISIPIMKNNIRVAVGSFGYGLSTNGDETGLAITYGLTDLTLQAGQTTVLSGDNATDSDFHAKLSGPGNVEIDATNDIIISNITNDYTGTTTIKSGQAILGTDKALGNTSSLDIQAGTSINLNGTKQTIGSLTSVGKLDMAGGNLTISNGGTTAANTLTGGGILTLTGGTLGVSGANTAFTATTNVGQGAEIILNDIKGLGANAITNNGNLTFTGVNGTVGNAVSGTGSIAITNNSAVNLLNPQTYGGGTSITDSSAIVASDAALGAATGGLSLNNATFTYRAAFDLAPTRALALTRDVTMDTNGFDTTLAQAITGDGSFTKAGNGKLSVTTNSSYNGQVLVDRGELKVNAIMADAKVTVGSGATLSGNNTLGSLVNKGIVAPGNSIGTIRVAGNFDNTNGTYACEVNDAGQSDLITVNGNITLGGTLSVIPMAGNYQLGQTYLYTILTSTNPITTTFNTVVGVSPLFNYTTIYQPNAVQLNMLKVATLSTIVDQGNAGNIAKSLDTAQNVTGTLQAAIATLNTLPQDQLTSAINQLGAANNASTQTGLANDFFDQDVTLLQSLHDPLERSKPNHTASSSFFGSLVGRISDIKSTLTQLFTPVTKQKTPMEQRFGVLPDQAQLPQSLRTQMGQASVWINTGIKSSTQKRQSDPGTFIPELGTTTSRTQVGLDYQVNQRLLVGVTAGYGHKSYRLSDNYGRGHVNSYQLGVYGTFNITPAWYVDGIASYSHHRLKGTRNISFANFTATASQQHSANQFGGIIETGYDVTLPCNFIATPLINVGLTHLYESGYQETGADTLGLNVKSRGRTYLQNKVGAQLAKYVLEGDTQLYGFIKLTYTYRKGLNHANRVTSAFMGQPTDFTVGTSAQPNNLISPSTGFTVLFKNDVYLTLGYNGDFGKYQRAHEGFIKIGKKF